MAFVWGGSNLAASLAAHGSFPRSLSRLSDKGRIPVRAIVMLELSYLVGLTLIYVAHVSLATCGRIVGAAVILTYMASAAAYVRLTPSRGPRRFLSPALIIVLSLVLVPFFGLTLVYPAIVVAAYGGFRLLSRSAANDLMPVPQRALRHVSLNSTLEGKDLRER
jgi:amino acid transporter